MWLDEFVEMVLFVFLCVHVRCWECECEQWQPQEDDRERVRYAIARQGRFEADGFAIPAKQLFSVTTMRSLSSFTSRTRWRVDWSFLSMYSSCWWKEDRSGVEGGSDDVCSESVCWSCSAWNRVSIYYRFRDAFAHIDAGARWFHWTCILQKDREIECTVLALHVVHFLVTRQRERIHFLFQMTTLLGQSVTPLFYSPNDPHLCFHSFSFCSCSCSFWRTFCLNSSFSFRSASTTETSSLRWLGNHPQLNPTYLSSEVRWQTGFRFP